MKAHFLFSFLFVAFALRSSLASPPATADTKVSFCNTTDKPMFMSVAYKPIDATELMARGWWKINSQSCTSLSLPMAEDKLLVHAESSSQLYQWLGDTPLCVNSVLAYNHENASAMSCQDENQEKRTFKEVTISQLPRDERSGELTYSFTEESATKVNAGIKFCNDNSEEVYLAFAQGKSGETNPTVDGWFLIKPKACFEWKRIQENNEIHFFAQSSNGITKWQGDVPLCTNDYDGFTFTESSTMACTENNQLTQLFKKENLPTEGEYEHHFKPEEAYQVRSIVEVCNSTDKANVVAVAYDNPAKSGEVISKGWYSIKPGECLKNVAVDSEKIYLRVEGDDRSVVLDGSFEACINAETAFTLSHSTTMACTAENEVKATFGEKLIEPGSVTIQIP